MGAQERGDSEGLLHDGGRGVRNERVSKMRAGGSRGELQELPDTVDMVRGEEVVSGFHDLLHMLFPDIPEP